MNTTIKLSKFAQIKIVILLMLVVILMLTSFNVAYATKEQTGIYGFTYLDKDENGQYSDTETKLSGVPVFLYQKDEKGLNLVANTVSDSFGEYHLDINLAGEYVLSCQIDTSGYYTTSFTVDNITSKSTQSVILKSSTNSQENNTQVNIGLSNATSAEITLFMDNNADGKKGTYEEIITDIPLSIVFENGIYANINSNDNNVYIYKSIPSYFKELMIHLPKGYAFTTLPAPNNGIYTINELSFQKEKATQINLGVVKVSTFSGKVFEDVNNNGIMDETEPGVAGIELLLTAETSKKEYKIISDETGYYEFSNLLKGNYIFKANLPEDKLFARYSSTGGDLRSVFSGQVFEREFYVGKEENVTNKNVGVIENGTILGTAFFDINYNGIFDEEETGYPGLTFYATRVASDEEKPKVISDENGLYEINGLRSGEYKLRVILPDDGSVFSVIPTNVQGNKVNAINAILTRRENTLNGININSGDKQEVYVGVAKGGSISGVAFIDANYNGVKEGKEKVISGLKVQLLDSEKNILLTTTANTKGEYIFKGILPGEYSIAFERLDKHGFTRVKTNEKAGNHVVTLIENYGYTNNIVMTMSEEIKNINAGQLLSATVSGVFLHDANDNSILEEHENGLTTTKVRLTSSDGEIQLTTTVDELGKYFFDGVMPTKYTLEFILVEHVHMIETKEKSIQISVKQGENFVVEQTGAVELGSFYSKFFNDSNGNGELDANEKPIKDVKVSLIGKNEYNAVSDANGNFSIIGIRPDTYNITITLPSDYIFSFSNLSVPFELKNSNAQTFICDWNTLISRVEHTIGLVKPASIEGILWTDENMNGTQETNESYFENCDLMLVDQRNGLAVDQVKSSNEGFVFNNVRPGKYTVQLYFPPQTQASTSKTNTFVTANNGMIQSDITVLEGEKVDGLLAGLVSKTNIGGRVILDYNGQYGMANVELSLIDDNAEVIATTLTTEDGNYLFEGLWPGNYTINAIVPKDVQFISKDDKNYPDDVSIIKTTKDGVGISKLISLKMAKHQLNENMILIKTGKVGMIAWVDLNKNGLIDGVEPLLPGVEINLKQNEEIIYTTTTDEFGYYIFDSVYPGDYVLEAKAYNVFSITKKNNKYPIITSCLTTGDGTLATSDVFTVNSGEKNMTYHLGYVLNNGEKLPQELLPPPTRTWTK